MPYPLTFSPELAAKIMRREKTFTRRPLKEYHRLLSRPIRVVSVLAKGLNDNPPVLWQVEAVCEVKFSRTGGAVFYRWQGDAVQFQTKAQVAEDAPDIWLTQNGYLPMRLKVVALFREPLAAMNDTTAKLEGFPTLEAFRKYWQGLYGGWNDRKICVDGQVWAIGIDPETPQKETVHDSI